MTDRPNHRAAAERMLSDADEWTAQAGELSPEASELSCLAYAGVHAIHDTLTAADRYAANEARQREEAEPDPLDEDDHRDRLGGGGSRWTHRAHLWCMESCACYEGSWKLDQIDDLFGPLTFAPDADGAPSVTAPVAVDPAGDAVDGEEGERRYLNAQTGHETRTLCLCKVRPSDVARTAANAERALLTAQLRQVISSVQDSGDLAELDALADEWEAGTDG